MWQTTELLAFSRWLWLTSYIVDSHTDQFRNQSLRRLLHQRAPQAQLQRVGVRLALTAGKGHDNWLAGKLLSRLKSGTILLADRDYDADWIRALVRHHGAWANIPPKRNRTETLWFSPYLYRARNLVERFFNKIKHCRRVATRYDKLAANYLAFVQLASIRLWLRVNESAP